MSKHTITHASRILAGDGVAINMGDEVHGMSDQLSNVQRGIRIAGLVHESLQGGNTDTQAFALNQAPSAGGEQDLVINGNEAVDGVGNMTVCSLVTITSSANDSARTFTVIGLDANGIPQAEEIAGPNTTTTSGNKTFTKIQRIFVDADVAGVVSAGESEANPRGLRRKTMDVEQSFRTGSAVHIPFDSGGSIETAGSFGQGGATQTPTNADPRARYTPVDQTGDLEIIYLADLTKAGMGENYTDSSQATFSAF